MERAVKRFVEEEKANFLQCIREKKYRKEDLERGSYNIRFKYKCIFMYIGMHNFVCVFGYMYVCTCMYVFVCACVCMTAKFRPNRCVTSHDLFRNAKEKYNLA